MNLGNFPKADCGRFWIQASTHVCQPKSTEKLNKAMLTGDWTNAIYISYQKPVIYEYSLFIIIM